MTVRQALKVLASATILVIFFWMLPGFAYILGALSYTNRIPEWLDDWILVAFLIAPFLLIAGLWRYWAPRR